MEKKSCLPEGGSNLFQTIKGWTTEAERRGIKIYRLSIGQPNGPALRAAREAAAMAVLSEEESLHEYQDNGSPGVPDFSQRFISPHQHAPLRKGLAYLPIPGIKPMLGLIPMACGGIHSEFSLSTYKDLTVTTMTEPGYPVPATWCEYLGIYNHPFSLNPENRFVIRDMPTISSKLFMLNYPHNPSGQVVTEAFWHKLCKFCQGSGIRIFNDAAYAMLTYDTEASTLAEVAQYYPDLSWAEAYSASKVIANGTGWRIGAMVGSDDFIADIAKVKGNTDSGFFAPAAYGVITCVEGAMDDIVAVRDLYRKRNDILIGLLSSFGAELAVQPGAGFFSLWKTPRHAFGAKITSSEQFNRLMIENTGVVGVHFEPYIRYSVTSPIEKPEWQEAIANAFAKADIKY